MEFIATPNRGIELALLKAIQNLDGVDAYFFETLIVEQLDTLDIIAQLFAIFLASLFGLPNLVLEGAHLIIDLPKLLTQILVKLLLKFEVS